MGKTVAIGEPIFKADRAFKEVSPPPLATSKMPLQDREHHRLEWTASQGFWPPQERGNERPR